MVQSLRGNAKDLYLEFIRHQDERTLRMLDRLPQSLGEFSWQFDLSVPPTQSLLASVGATATFRVPWQADAFRLSAWTLADCEVIFSFAVAHAEDLTAFSPLSVEQYAADPSFVFEDTTVSVELDETGTTPAPDGSTLLLSGTGFRTSFVAGDLIKVTLEQVLDIPPLTVCSYFGGALDFRLRNQQYAVTRSPA